MSSVGYHEPIEELSDESRELHRAIVSLMEELEGHLSEFEAGRAHSEPAP